MFRLLLSLFFVLILTRVDAQTDTARPSAAQSDSVVPHLSAADSARRDSVARVRKAHRDSLRLVRIAARKDSLLAAQKDSAAKAAGTAGGGARGGTGNTLAVKRDSPAVVVKPSAARVATAQGPPAGITEGPPALSFWQKVLAANPAFNFTGKPVEIGRAHV